MDHWEYECPSSNYVTTLLPHTTRGLGVGGGEENSDTSLVSLQVFSFVLFQCLSYSHTQIMYKEYILYISHDIYVLKSEIHCCHIAPNNIQSEDTFK